MHRVTLRVLTRFMLFLQVSLYYLDVRGDDLPEDIPMYGYGSGYVPLEKESLNEWLDVLKVHAEEEVVPRLMITPGERLSDMLLSHLSARGFCLSCDTSYDTANDTSNDLSSELYAAGCVLVWLFR
jgi:hypothetical protein